MGIKHVVALLTIFIFQSLGAQMPDNFGKVASFELEMTSHEKDPEANAVVLYERGDNYFKVVDQRIRLIKEYHGKIKIFNEKAFDKGTVKIPLYHSKNGVEKLKKIKAVTHNGKSQHNVLPAEIFTTDLSEKWRQKSFTFPKLQAGSILEYSYTIETPFDFNLTGWAFQQDIPVIYSEFNASIPGNWSYNRSLKGSLNLDVNDAQLKKNCFHLESVPEPADCEVLKYVMKDVPAFKVEEDFMLAPSNYVAKIEFELSEYRRFDGTSNKFTETWEDVDKKFRSNKDIGRQLSKKGFFEKNVPENLLIEGDALTKAKNIYTFIQNHYTWNEDYGIYGKARVKDAFEQKKGNVSEINMSLINLLNAAGIKTNLMLLSTRQSGLPKKIHPVMNDFNYVVAKTEIDGQNYLLDATDKYMAFGMLPFHALNHYGRVMDFNNDSYWYDIKPESKNKHQVRAQVSFNMEEKRAEGIFDVVNMGYNAISTRETLDNYSEEEYLERIEKDIEGEFSITTHEVRKDLNNDKKVSERFEFEIENIGNGDMVYFNPFFIRFFEKNPFLLEERNYPVDFGYPRNYKYSVNINLPEGYKVQELPEKKAVQLGDKLVILQFFHQENPKQIAFVFELSLNSTHIQPKNYQGLKDLFKHVTDIQNNSLIVLKKTETDSGK